MLALLTASAVAALLLSRPAEGWAPYVSSPALPVIEPPTVSIPDPPSSAVQPPLVEAPTVGIPGSSEAVVACKTRCGKKYPYNWRPGMPAPPSVGRPRDPNYIARNKCYKRCSRTF